MIEIPPLQLSAKVIRNDFVRKIEELSGENAFRCMQCGMCSAGCPFSSRMMLTPSEVIRAVQMGDEQVVLANSVWSCASCLTCSVRCPKGIDVARIIEAVRLWKLRKNENQVEPSELSKEELKKLPQIALVSNFRKMTG
ncbi:MAG: 4Fe-4S dicluster domain-containing protein [Promethearchaeota archaeon]